MQRYLFQVSIGPVQDFISAARRTRDLKFGSDLLSELSKAAAKAIAANSENVLIFPTPPNPESLEPNSNFNAANKIVALIEEDSPETLSETGEKVRKAVLKRLDEIKEKTYEQLGSFNKGDANLQIEDLVEFFWVALPYDSGHYKDIRENVEALMAARKNTRDFSRVKWGSRQPKSSIDGQLESVISDNKYFPAQLRDKANYLYSRFGAKQGEHLSGVDLLKRKGPLYGDSFPSTSHFATIPFLQRLETLNEEAKKLLKQYWGTYIQTLEKVVRIERLPTNSPLHPILGNCEGSMLLEERFSDLVDNREDLIKCEPAKEKLREFFKQVDKQFPNVSPKVRPGIYYAILLADGDSMGKVIDHQAAAANGETQHRELSKALANFSGKVRAIVEGNKDIEGHHGSLIYAGGDDVLAFMPLHTMLQCAQKLAETFYNDLKDFHDSSGNSPTLSVGIAVIHHLHPLREALKLARNAEKIAKQVDGKNALAITISKRSGSDFTIRGSWTDFYKNLEKLLGFCREGAIPEGTAFELRDLSLRLADQTGSTNSATLLEIIEAEAKRILQRKLSFWRSNEAQADKKQILEDTHKQIIAMLADFVKSGRTADEPPIEHFANILIAAQFFADAMELAQPMKGAQQ